MVVALLGVAVLITYSLQNGIILLVIAFLISPYGYEVVGGKPHAIIKQTEMLPVGTHELSHVQ